MSLIGDVATCSICNGACTPVECAVRQMRASRDVHDHEHPKKGCHCNDCRRARVTAPSLKPMFDWEIQEVAWDDL